MLRPKSRFVPVLPLLALAWLAIGCTKKAENTVDMTTEVLTPEQSVERFVRMSAGAKTAADKTKLRDLCQGKLRQAFDKMSPENFQMSYLAGGVSVESFKIVSQKTEGTDALVTYKVGVANKQGTGDQTQEVNEREVSLVQVNGVWYLDSIRMSGKDQIAFVNGMMF